MKKIFVAATVTALAVIGSVAFTALASAQAPQDASASVAGAKAITIWRDPGCGCCDTYADYLETNGFSVTRVDDRDFDKRSVEMGVPERGTGITLPGMPGNAPGMAPAKTGTLKTYAFGKDGVAVYSDE